MAYEDDLRRWQREIEAFLPPQSTLSVHRRLPLGQALRDALAVLLLALPYGLRSLFGRRLRERWNSPWDSSVEGGINSLFGPFRLDESAPNRKPWFVKSTIPLLDRRTPMRSIGYGEGLSPRRDFELWSAPCLAPHPKFVKGAGRAKKPKA